MRHVQGAGSASAVPSGKRHEGAGDGPGQRLSQGRRVSALLRHHDPEGAGDLALAFEQLKERLYKEGLFDEAHKKPLPRFPERIAIVTSSAGAAVHDMIRILRRRYPLAKVILLPVRVQGAEAPPEIAGAIRYADKWKIGDVIITGRGGGSMEDCGPSTMSGWPAPSTPARPR